MVGTRVVVRRVVRGETGPSGGPALTDVLGTCTSWGAGRCVVVREDGSAVEIALADIVSGKPVPPRPSVRSRVPALDVERHTFVMWPSLRVEEVGGWALRQSPPARSGRRLRRANSMLAVGDPGIPVSDASQRAVAFYASHAQQPLAHVEPGSAEAEALAGLGWSPLGSGDAWCQVASVARALRACDAVSMDHRRRRDSVQASPAARCTEEGPRLLVELVDETGTTAARGEAALDDGWVGISALHVDEGRRRQGLATRVMAEALDWAASRGAASAWLHVEVDDPAAAGLYERLAFVTHHRMGYLAGPA